jgi:hypothetical protein
MKDKDLMEIQLEAMRLVLSVVAAKAHISSKRLKELLDMAVEDVTQIYMEQNNEMVN